MPFDYGRRLKVKYLCGDSHLAKHWKYFPHGINMKVYCLAKQNGERFLMLTVWAHRHGNTIKTNIWAKILKQLPHSPNPIWPLEAYTYRGRQMFTIPLGKWRCVSVKALDNSEQVGRRQVPWPMSFKSVCVSCANRASNKHFWKKIFTSAWHLS